MSSVPYALSPPRPFLVPLTPRIRQGYFRSKLFVTASTTNPVVAAASPLLSLMERLCLSPSLPKIDSIRDNIEHELHAFHSKLASHNYAHEFVMIADYLLSATIDELLGKNYMRLYNQTAQFQAFTPISEDGLGAEHRFFDLVNSMKQRANQYLDILELAYYCLITGFEGEQHIRPNGRQTLDNLIDELHRLIQQHRVNKPHRLFNEQQSRTLETTSHRKPILFTVLLILSVLLSMVVGSQSLLNHKAKTLIPNAIPPFESR
jgi:type VI secretion system protein ImpK